MQHRGAPQQLHTPTPFVGGGPYVQYPYPPLMQYAKAMQANQRNVARASSPPLVNSNSTASSSSLKNNKDQPPPQFEEDNIPADQTHQYMIPNEKNTGVDEFIKEHFRKQAYLNRVLGATTGASVPPKRKPMADPHDYSMDHDTVLDEMSLLTSEVKFRKAHSEAVEALRRQQKKEEEEEARKKKNSSDDDDGEKSEEREGEGKGLSRAVGNTSQQALYPKGNATTDLSLKPRGKEDREVTSPLLERKLSDLPDCYEYF